MSNNKKRKTTNKYKDKNRYYTLTVPKYGKLVDEIMNANTYEDIERSIDDTYCMITPKDITIPVNKKESIRLMLNAINHGLCVEEPPMSLVRFLREHDYNLEEYLQHKDVYNPLRKIYESLNMGKYFNIEYIPISVMNAMILHGYYTRPRPVLKTRGCNHGDLILALLSAYSENILPHQYSKKLMVVVFIKNLSLLSSATCKTDETELISNNIFNLLDFVLNDIIVRNISK